MIEGSDRHACHRDTQNGTDAELFAEIVSTLRLWPWDVATLRAQDPGRLLRLVEAALARERRDGLAGHWAYDLNRHMRLVALRRRLTADVHRSVNRVPTRREGVRRSSQRAGTQRLRGRVAGSIQT